MSAQKFERRLSTILAADVQGYSRLIGEDDEGTVKRLTAYRDVIERMVGRHGGRVSGTAGDSVIAELPSAVEAVRCAVAIQEELAVLNAEVPDDKAIWFRMGISIGDIIDEGRDIHGDGINIAVRLEGLSEPGGICISGPAYEQVKNKVSVSFKDLGEHRIKNIAEPVRTYEVVLPHFMSRSGRPATGKGARRWQVPAIAAAVVLVAVAVSSGYWTPFLQSASNIRLASIGDIKLPASGDKRAAIAVLPFKNMSDDPAQEYFSDGIAEDLIINLAQNPNLIVLARRTSFSFKGKTISIAELCNQLDVKYVVEGSVRKAQDRVRITAQLVNASGQHIWASRFDRSLKDVFAVQDEITEKISTKLTAKLQPAQVLSVPLPAGTKNPDAYDAFLRGRDKFQKWTPSDNTASVKEFERAIRLDPNYARAYAYLAFSRVNRFRFMGLGDVLPKASLLDAALERAQKAVKLAPKDYFGHAVLGTVYRYRGEFSKAIPALETAIKLNANDPESLSQWGFVLRMQGKADGAVRLLELAQKLDPKVRDYPMQLGMAAYVSRDYEKAVQSFDRAIDTYRKSNPKRPETQDPIGPHIWKAASLGQLAKSGDDIAVAEAKKAAKAVVTRMPGYQIAIAAARFERSWRKRDLCHIIEGLELAGLPRGYETNEKAEKTGCH